MSRVIVRLALAAALCVAALGVPTAALAAFPGEDPDESVRANPPNDPRFDGCEQDNEGGASCSNVFDQDLERFGFAPSATQFTATYRNPQDTRRQQRQNVGARRNPLGQLSGVSADRAWKFSIGRPDVEIAILDTGIRWENEQLRTKVALNERELPTPSCGRDDCNRDGAFDVDDFAGDPRVRRDGGAGPADELLDASDLIAAFSDSRDGDRNGYVDDIAGWDFFDDDNDPFDVSSYSSAKNHGTGRGLEAGSLTNDGKAGTGVCPRCQVVPMRVWDTFVVDTNNFAQASLYAADNGIEVVEGAVGALFNSTFARAAFEHAYRRGVFFAIVSSDLNTANHNVPTLYDEALQVQGSVADLHGLGEDAPEVGAFLGAAGIPTNAPIGTWFRNSGTTQYGGHAHIVMPAVTGSQATGQASGAAGLLVSYARERGRRLAPNEVKQLLTLTAEDVVPENTVGTGVPDPARRGWDQHFGYGRPDLGLAMERIRDGRLPPQALITSPEWFRPLNVERTPGVAIGGRLSARPGRYSWRLQWAPGIEPAEHEFRDAAGGDETAARDGTLATIDLRAVRAALDARPGGGATFDPTAPAKGPGDRDPNEPAFTVRVIVTDADGTRGEDRKMLFAYRDPTLHRGFGPREIVTGGEASERMWDFDGDNRLDLVQADSSGRLTVLGHDGRPLRSFNRGRPVRTRRYPNVHPRARSYRTLDPPREVLRTPAIGDIDGDRAPEIVDSAGEHVYAWNHDGSRVRGFPVRVDPSFSEPRLRTRKNHVKRGFIASPTLGDLNGDRRLDIVIPALDQHLYAWDGRGRALPGFPRRLREKGSDLDGAESINTAALGNIAGDRKPEVVAPTNEIGGAENPSSPPAGFGDLAAEIRSGFTTLVANAAGGAGRTYAVGARGGFVDGWPVKPNGAVPDALPLVGPGVDPAMGDVDGDGRLDVVGAFATGDVHSHRGDGSRITTYDPMPPTGEHVDKSRVLNLFENPIVANLDGLPGLEVIKGGVTLNQLVNIGVAVGQNLPYNHVVQAWNGRTGESLPSFPQAVEDYQLLSSPAVADVSDAPGAEIVVGTGLYYLRNLSASGAEGPGFPKFTGGWIFATPAVGDVDGDGRLEVSVVTREGYSFLWDTNRPACGGNDEWWTARHDERSTGAYGTDTRPPGTPRGLTVHRRSGGRLRLSFTAPGDDWLCGDARRYAVVASRKPFGAPRGRALATGAAVKLGRRQGATVRLRRGARYVGVIYQDDAGNWGAVAGRRVAARAGRGGDRPGGRRPSLTG